MASEATPTQVARPSAARTSLLLVHLLLRRAAAVFLGTIQARVEGLVEGLGILGTRVLVSGAILVEVSSFALSLVEAASRDVVASSAVGVVGRPCQVEKKRLRTAANPALCWAMQ